MGRACCGLHLAYVLLMGPIEPIRPARVVRRQPRPEADPRDAADAVLNLTVNMAPPPEPPATPYRPPTNLDAHLIAQENRVRGLRGGQQVLDTARSAYLEAEYSGLNDRRALTGQIKKTDV
jgi:hypothetical protein